MATIIEKLTSRKLWITVVGCGMAVGAAFLGLAGWQESVATCGSLVIAYVCAQGAVDTGAALAGLLGKKR